MGLGVTQAPASEWRLRWSLPASTNGPIKAQETKKSLISHHSVELIELQPVTSQTSNVRVCEITLIRET